ncbi:MAG: PHP domain-containing protein [Bryobacterales bacterium]|nr:PHP domain-containing protein [Bryobacteraceae bacterium]MDW8355882.1 PHP domain-containing protein [Bryobacterales bacterium]
MIDLHAHTNESDGSLAPEELVDCAVRVGLEALAICDHDTLAGFDKAAPVAEAARLELVCGVELSTKFERRPGTRPKTVHLLGYFLNGPAPETFRQWLANIQQARRDRNRRLVERLNAVGLAVTLEEVEALGRNLTGRPHFAQVLVQKGYVASVQQAFDEYLDEGAKAYVHREEPSFQEGLRRIREAGGLSSLAHPLRLMRHRNGEFEDWLAKMVEMGLDAIEAYYSEHSPQDVARFLDLAQRYGLAVTGGSDFHGAAKPNIELGTGLGGNLSIPRSVLDALRARLRR